MRAACLLVLALPVFAQPGDMQRWKKIASSVTITRDTYGVPHVECARDADCVFGFIYAQAEDFFWQIEDDYLRSLGRAAEIYGPAELDEDLFNRMLEISRKAEEQYKAGSPTAKLLTERIADGLNFYLATHPATKPRLLTRIEPWYVNAFALYATSQLFRGRRDGLQNSQVESAASVVGSNAWAIAPSRSAGRTSMLFINPHQPFFGAGQWYEGHVRSKEGWNLSGATFFGFGFPSIGFNEQLGWTHTVNTPDTTDFYEEKFTDPANPLHYRYGNGWRDATEWTEKIGVKKGDAVEWKTYKLMKTHHGPIVSRQGNKVLALRMTGLDRSSVAMEQRYRMGKARNLKEFQAALGMLGTPFFNTVYADRDGNIWYVYYGAIPRRATQYDWSKPVDGSDPETEWQGLHPLEELPQVLNPKSGFVQNCNGTPFLATSEGNPIKDNFPAYMAPEPDTPRAQMSRRILAGTAQISYDELNRLAFDTRLLRAETEVPAMIKAWKDNPADGLKPVIAELEKWDFKASTNSVATTVYLLWLERYTPRRQTLDVLTEAVTTLEKQWGTWQVPWGDLSRIQRPDARQNANVQAAFRDSEPSIPVAGAPGPAGVVFNFYPFPAPGQKRRYGMAGTSYAGVVEFGKTVKAKTILQFGESGDPASPHYFDQAPLYARQEFKPAWFSKAEIASHKTRVYHPGE